MVLLARASEGSVRDAISLLDRALVFQNLNPSKTIDAKEIRKMLGLVDKSKLIYLLKHVLLGDEKNALKQGGSDAIKFQHKKGRKTIRERINYILDSI